MKEIFSKIETSFRKAIKGEENLSIVIWFWGAIAYVTAFFIIEKMVQGVNLISFDVVISVVMVVYFVWHLYVLIKCNPKKPKLTKEEKERLKEEARKERGKRILRKLFLREPITQTNPVIVTAVIDLFFISHFGGYIF